MMRLVKSAAAVLVACGALLVGCDNNDAVAPVASRSCGELLYAGGGKPDVIVVSDFPRRGIGAEATKLMVDAIEYVLRRRDFRAGDYEVGYQSCNDTVGDEPFDEHLCRRNARAYVATADVVGIIGPWNSGCAEVQIPIVSRKEAGPLAMISPANSFIGLTVPAAGARRLYPDGIRNYVRVVTHDIAQGSAAAQVARTLRARRVALIHQDFEDAYARDLTLAFRESAQGLGLKLRQFKWRRRKSYRALAHSVAAFHPQAVYLAGVTQVNAKRLVLDLRATLGSGVTFIGPDSFAAADIARALGGAGEGMRVTAPGIPPQALPAAGKRFVHQFGAALTEPRALGAPEAAQATEVLLDAIARSDKTRASVVKELLATRITNGILGSFSFDQNGDIIPRPVGIYRFHYGKIATEAVVRVPLGGAGKP